MAAEESLQTYRGNCHCGAFIFEMQAPEIKSVGDCNCSICTKKGYMWVLPKGDINIVKGEGTLAEYSFGPKQTKHLFCPDCGTPIGERRIDSKKWLINARTIQKIDLWKLELKPIDRASAEPKYEPPVYNGPEPSAEVEGGKIYTGSCHCGAVTLAVKDEPLGSEYEEGRIVDCNCSVCRRGGYVWIYPKKTQVVVQGEENLKHYVFGRSILGKSFCKTCGVHISNDSRVMTTEQEKALFEEERPWHNRVQGLRPVTLRVLNNFDLKSVKPTPLDGWAEMPRPYMNP